MLDFIRKNLGLWVLLSLSLGLAPFAPEPHIWGKLKWIAGGAKGMQAVDWFDAIMHGAPWLLLILSLLLQVRYKLKKGKLPSADR